MDGALREDSALVLCDGGVELIGLAVLHYEAGAHAKLAGSSESEELGGAGMDVRGVQPTALEEDGSC